LLFARLARRGIPLLGQGIFGGCGHLPRDGPGSWVIEAAVVDFAHALHKVAVFFEMLAQGDDLRQGIAEVGREVPDLGGVRPGAGHEAGPGRRTEGLLAIGPGEDHAGLGEAVDVRAFDIVFPITSQFRPEVIDRDEQHVGLPGSLAGAGNGVESQEEEQGAADFHGEDLLGSGTGCIVSNGLDDASFNEHAIAGEREVRVKWKRAKGMGSNAVNAGTFPTGWITV